MARWQRRARIGVGLFGIAFAIVVYAAIGERQAPRPQAKPTRFDPRAILETAGAAFQRFQEARKDFVVRAERQLTYEGGATKFFGVSIEVRNRGGRDFVVSGREAQATKDNAQLEITGDVRLAASDGFSVLAGQATFDQTDATLHVPGPVSFGKGRMSGSGVGMTYNQNTDVLSLAGDARVTVSDEAGKPVTEFRAGMATLSRQDDFLALEGNVRALREEQVLEAERGIARLSEDDEHITYIELRGNARVTGGDVFHSMRAGDIDLDYTDDGATLERVVLTGRGTIVMRGEGEAAGRQFAGDSLELRLASDSTLTAVSGRGDVQVQLPQRAGTPARHVAAEVFDASGEAGKGLTAARFSDGVEYREEGLAGRKPRIARSSALQLTLADEVVTGAVFTGRVRFEEEELAASGARGAYDPAAGTLRLSGADAGGGPRVADAQIEIEADSIDVTLEGPRMTASGNVKTVLQPRKSPRDGKLPALLQQGTPVNVIADTLDYQGAAGTATYSGGAALWQGETAIRGDLITIDRSQGDLIAAGSARSTLVLDTGVSVGRAGEIRYEDSARRIVYSPPAPAGATGIAPKNVGGTAPTAARGIAPGSVSGTASTGGAQVSGPQGDLRALRIEVMLARTESRVERLEAHTGVNIRLDTRVATGDRLTYVADEERYVMTGIATVPVKIVEECRETSGRTVVFFKSADRIIVDGNEEVRTQSSRGGPCPPAPVR